MNAEKIIPLLQSGWTLSLALAVILVIRKPMRRWLGARAAYATWALVPMIMVASFLPPPPSSAGFSVVAALAAPTGLRSVLTSADSQDWRQLLIAAWMTGIVGAAVLFAGRQARFADSIRRSARSAYDEIHGHGPAVVGLLRPRIVLPADFTTRYSAHEQSLVIAHEQVHIRRGDVYAQLVATALRCLFWFNPLVHYAASRFRFDQELACDAVVLELFPSSRRAYGEAMLKTQLAEFGLPAGCHWQSSHPLKERISMLIQAKPTRSRRIAASVLVAALVVAGSVAAWAGQPVAPAPQFLTYLKSTDVVSNPTYPPAALASGQSGSVLLDIWLAADGRVTDVRVVKSQPAGVFDQAAIEAARTWHFDPTRRDGPLQAGWVRVPVKFSPNKPAG